MAVTDHRMSPKYIDFWLFSLYIIILALLLALCVLTDSDSLVFIGEIFRVANLQIKEQKVLVDELCNLKKNRVSGGSGKVSKFIRSHHYLCSYDGKHANHIPMLSGWCSHVF